MHNADELILWAPLTQLSTSSCLVYTSIINLRRDEVELPNGRHSFREVIEHPGGVCVLPLTDDDEIVFVRQFRYPYKQVLLEIPAGKRDHGGEDPDVYKRQLPCRAC